MWKITRGRVCSTEVRKFPEDICNILSIPAFIWWGWESKLKWSNRSVTPKRSRTTPTFKSIWVLLTYKLPCEKAATTGKASSCLVHWEWPYLYSYGSKVIHLLTYREKRQHGYFLKPGIKKKSKCFIPRSLGIAKHVPRLGVQELQDAHSPAGTFLSVRNRLHRAPSFSSSREKSAKALGVQAGFSSTKTEVTANRKSQGKQWGVGGRGRLRVGMAAQIPIVATTATPGVARNSKKRPASPSHNGSSTGVYGASKKKRGSASGFAQVLCSSAPLRVRVGRAGRGGAGRGESAGWLRAERSEGAFAGPSESGRMRRCLWLYLLRGFVPGTDETFSPLVRTRGSSIKNLSAGTALAGRWGGCCCVSVRPDSFKVAFGARLRTFCELRSSRRYKVSPSSTGQTFTECLGGAERPKVLRGGSLRCIDAGGFPHSQKSASLALRFPGPKCVWSYQRGGHPRIQWAHGQNAPSTEPLHALPAKGFQRRSGLVGCVCVLASAFYLKQ